MADSDLVIDNIIYEIGKRIYPVGSIYISVKNTDPTTLFGGTWIPIYDAVLYAVNNNTEPSEDIIGSNTVALTKNNMPYYNLGFLPAIVMSGVEAWDADALVHDGSGAGSAIVWDTKQANSLGDNAILRDVSYIIGRTDGNETAKTLTSTQWGYSIYSKTFTSHTTANGDSFSILPRHLDVYMWRRTA